MKYKPSGFLESQNTYYEPFVGAGAFLFDLEPKKAVISDRNQELINCYNAIKKSVEELIEELQLYQDKKDLKSYYKTRIIDRKPQKYNNLSPVQKAARIIYLNKTCYNGLYRVNSKNQFNVPYGGYKNPKILDESVLIAVSDYLNNNEVKILNLDFEKAVKDARKGDFIYFDPPYHPVSDTAYFTGYDINGFNKDEQERLKEIFDELDEKGCKIMLSNSKTEFILDLYRGYRIETVKATRTINSNALKRGKIDEILVLNYD
ncbi:MAG: Dam family site-specific DNA-(adenine-N6)-methyltransferase [Okeania sp. SIO2H7]|nr:Dam family site-specific DNA-(adenine-N6)-methyltransferase [Okeania sp. SIO2H7]